MDCWLDPSARHTACLNSFFMFPKTSRNKFRRCNTHRRRPSLPHLKTKGNRRQNQEEPQKEEERKNEEERKKEDE